MEFIDILNGVLQVAGKLAEQWPALAIGVAVIPVTVNLIKWLLAQLGVSIDGYSGYVKIGLNFVAFAVYFYASANGIDFLAWEPVIIAVGTVLAALAGWLGANGLQARVLYPLAKKLPGPFGFSYSK